MKHLFLLALLHLFFTNGYAKFKQHNMNNDVQSASSRQKPSLSTNKDVENASIRESMLDAKVFAPNVLPFNKPMHTSSPDTNDLLIYGIIGLEIGISVVLFIAFILEFIKSQKKEDFSLLTFS